MKDELLINYRKLFKLKGYCDICYINLDPMKIGKFICKLRIENGDSQYTLADKVKISRQAVSKWERGITIPNHKSLMKLSDIYHISINEILNSCKKDEESTPITMEEYERQVNNNIELSERINKTLEFINHRQEDINNGGNEHEYRSNEFIVKILKGEDKQ